MVSLLLAIIYLAFISLGLPDSLLGAGWPVMHSFLGVELSAAGVVSMIISGGTILSSLCSERLTCRLGTRLVTLFSVVLTAAAMLGFSTATRFWHLCLWAIPFGLGAGSIDAALNNYVALHYNARQMSWLHCFWGLGAIISPYIMSLALTRSTWQAGYRSVGLIQLGIALVLLLTLRLWRVHAEPGGTDGKGEKLLGLRAALRIPGVPQILLGFFAYCSAEATCMLWSASYLTEVRGLAPERAAAFASLFFIGITAGRFLSGLISDRVGDRNMIRLGVAVGLCGAVLTGLPGLPAIVSEIGLVVIGLGCAPVYPSIIHATPANFGAAESRAIIGVQMASAYVGSTFMPPLFGLISGAVGLWFLPLFAGAFLLLCVVLTGRAFRLAGRNAAEKER